MELRRSKCFICFLTLLNILTGIGGGTIYRTSLGHHPKDGTYKFKEEQINNNMSGLKAKKLNIDLKIKEDLMNLEVHSNGDTLSVGKMGDLVVRTSIAQGRQTPPLENLEQIQKSYPGPLQCEKYLIRFGYLKKKDANDTAAKRSAYRKFQKNFNLRPTSVCDRKTKWLMSQPRCNRQDQNAEEANHRSKRYVLNGRKWATLEITYCIVDLGDYLTLHPLGRLSKQDITEAIAQAIKFWDDASQLTITINCTNPDIQISMFSGIHSSRNDDVNFDGAGHVLAHTFDPPDGDVHFDADEPWTLGSIQGINFLQVATHELGHSLGLNHSKNHQAVMASIYRAYDRHFELYQDDIAGIQSLYGAPPSKEGVYEGYGANIIFHNIAKFVELKIAINYEVAGCPSNENEIQTLLCFSIKEQAKSTDIEIKKCKYLRTSSDGIISIELDIIPPPSGTSLKELASIFNRGTLNIYPCAIGSTRFAATTLRCSPIYKSTCSIGNANCQTISTGYTCICPPRYVMSDHASQSSRCRLIREETSTARTTQARTFPDTATWEEPIHGDFSSDIVIGLSIGGVIIFLIILVAVVVLCCCCRKRKNYIGRRPPVRAGSFGNTPIMGEGGMYVYPDDYNNSYGHSTGLPPPGRGFWYA